MAVEGYRHLECSQQGEGDPTSGAGNGAAEVGGHQ